jgi:glycosyltransferase involved in cell wall biosynthesis
MFKLAIVSTHPIQYNAPLFQHLAQLPGLSVRVFYTWSQSISNKKYDPDFGKVITWDIPLLEGYDFQFVTNISLNPGSHHFKGIDNPTLISEIKNWKPNAVLVIGWSYKSHLKCLRYFKGKLPVLFRGDSTLLDEKSGIKKVIRRLFLKYVYSFIDYALYVGSNNKKYFLAHGLKEKQLRFAPHAIDNNRFSKNEYEVQAMEWRRDLGIPNNSCVLLFAGKLEPKKDPELLLSLYDKISNENVYVIFVGNGPLEKYLKEKAKGKERIIFLDFQNQQKMPVVYRLADVFILPSKGPGETWGLALNEAMACGRAVIGSEKAGGANDLIKQNVNGFVFQSGNVDEVYRYLKPIINDKEKVRKMGEESKKLIQSFSYEKIGQSVLQLAKEIEKNSFQKTSF